MRERRKLGFTLIELLVVISIIGVMAGIIIVATAGVRGRARDVKRKSDLAQIGRVLYASACYIPNSGAGDYDLQDLVPELTARYPQYAQYSSFLPRDPKTGTATATNYRYQYSSDGHCAIYTNLENENEPVTLTVLIAPSATGGTGTLRAQSSGPNGTEIYYQIAK
ncbi:MAG: hypothetical protein A2722_00950 [Candidatus Doudnabacteria bacterium RIFCSPHIGHO2_01_FULL_50_11]|uniref:Type II secretion system protein GspG C-terminal domain-containing protein n=1 Tax=Candidatus Doudnabacteria bacterium RIFCSPHIGHO2_01_FULL_50_11 TaxID=1817828 RepID=A0A1F5PF01_9BACT|nr:MAG: hypothetical protein A2722_00950 [Candidatus Doudnabacteria bacterium RIFCSPHIGHO2_01_FULL_50_11]HLC44711.1 prepilin-type N-terminal cleavage/methylation domain-containing protein [Patescibacteria group bacterium]